MSSLLAADKLIANPQLYATFLLWLMSELFEQMPEVGDPEKPKLVFFFDEARPPVPRRAQGLAGKGRAGGAPDPIKGIWHLLSSSTNLARTCPETLPLGQSGNRRPSMPCGPTRRSSRGDCGPRPTASSRNPAFETGPEAIQGLGVGEALVSVLDERAAPTHGGQDPGPPAELQELGPATPARAGPGQWRPAPAQGASMIK